MSFILKFETQANSRESNVYVWKLTNPLNWKRDYTLLTKLSGHLRGKKQSRRKKKRSVKKCNEIGKLGFSIVSHNCGYNRPLAVYICLRVLAGVDYVFKSASVAY